MAWLTGKHRWLSPGVLIGALVPLAVLLDRLRRNELGADPIATALNALGLLALVLLVASLAATPMRLLFGFNWPLRIRRLLGLLAFFYACLHALLYVVVDQGLAVAAILRDVTERPFITLGAGALLLLIPLALTSTNASRKRLGNKRWLALHRLAYVAALLAAGHFFLRVKRDLTEPLVYAVILAALLAIRAWHRAQEQQRERLTKG
jgi:sulfoxide reductase heme-binding subunit YedZ